MTRTLLLGFSSFLTRIALLDFNRHVTRTVWMGFNLLVTRTSWMGFILYVTIGMILLFLYQSCMLYVGSLPFQYLQLQQLLVLVVLDYDCDMHQDYSLQQRISYCLLYTSDAADE